MRLAKSLLSIIAISVLLLACNRPPDLSVVPAIAWEGVEFRVENPGDPLQERTVLRVSIQIEDGDGDLGLSADDDGFIYAPYHVVFNNDGEPVQFGERPEDPPFFTCLDYVDESRENIDLNNDQDLNDTIRIEFNDDQYNFLIDFFRKRNGVFEEVDIRAQPPGSANVTTLCNTSFDGRFPCLSSNENPCEYIEGADRPIRGVLNYDIESFLFLPIFRTDTLMVRIHVKDRALNESNVIESPEFTLQGVQTLIDGN